MPVSINSKYSDNEYFARQLKGTKGRLVSLIETFLQEQELPYERDGNKFTIGQGIFHTDYTIKFDMYFLGFGEDEYVNIDLYSEDQNGYAEYYFHLNALIKSQSFLTNA
jgi:hypothetical protein